MGAMIFVLMCIALVIVCGLLFINGYWYLAAPLLVLGWVSIVRFADNHTN